MNNKKKIFIACDTSSTKKINQIIVNSKKENFKFCYKIGLQFFFTKKGRHFISKLKGEEIFLDIKLNDIPNTCTAALRSLKDLKRISYITAHCSGGLEMLKSIRKTSKKINNKIKILGVTILTSFSNSSIKEIGHTKSINELVKKQARLAKKARLDGIVCSGKEAKSIKKICKNMEIITPGIRLKGDKTGDQKRVVTPKQAFRNGATAIVIGRSVTDGNLKKNIKVLIKEIK